MDLTRMISQLRLEKEHTGAAIASLERFAALSSGISEVSMKSVKKIKRDQVRVRVAGDGAN
jgi:hypothetical protein